jgi:uncharacterized protein YciI
MEDRVAERLWFVLLHTPAAGVQGSVFDHPGIREHYAFLQRRAEAGELIAAGPLPDQDGSGMTVLEVTDQSEAERLAREDDLSVSGGLLEVTVRPWRVLLSRS